ncbi:MAG: sulfonate transport system substrate-binding protein, partial [Methanosarcinales archaeon]|nr:sulfonate transport system substrate-binding protein [Methanosarcinales archaeon]
YTDERVLTALVWAHIKATEFINDPANHDKVVQYAMEFTGKDRAVAEKALTNIAFVEYPDVEEFRNYYYRLKEGQLLKKTPEQLGYRDESAFFDDFLTDEYYRAVKEKLDANPNWVPEKVSPSETVRVGHLAADLHELAVYVAQKEGYYEQVGLVSGENLFIKGNYANGVAAMEAFRNEEIDVGYLGGAPATLKRINDDVKIRIIAGANNVGSSIMVAASSDIHTPKDLAGKTIATPGVGTVQDFIVRQVAEENGLKVVLK